MYMFYKGQEDQYGYLGYYVKEDGKSKLKSVYLGRTVDKERGIFKNKQGRLYSFDLVSLTSSYLPDSYLESKQNPDSLLFHNLSFGGVWFLLNLIYDSELNEVIDVLPVQNRDTLYTLIFFYVLCDKPNCRVEEWYEKSIARLLFPNASLSPSSISRTLELLGDPVVQLCFQQKWIAYLKEHWSSEFDSIIDSTDLPNSNHTKYTQVSKHNGEFTKGARLVALVLKLTGIPILWRLIPGNVLDVSTLKPTLAIAKELGVDIGSLLLDAGYFSGENLDLFYTEDHELKIPYVMRIKDSDSNFKEMIKRYKTKLLDEENLVEYQDRTLLFMKEKIYVGSGHNNPAWLYLGLDIARRAEEVLAIIKKKGKKKDGSISSLDVLKKLTDGGFFGILSGEELKTDEILPTYYFRQTAEQNYDFTKNYTKILPLRVGKEETQNGHLLLSIFAASINCMIAYRLKETDLMLSDRLDNLSEQTCTVFPNKIIISEMQERSTNTLKAFNIEIPTSIALENGHLQFKAKEAEDKAKQEFWEEKKPGKRGRPKGSKNKKKQTDETEGTEQKPKKRGRPKGSRNLTPEERAAREAAKGKKRRGRPKKVKNN